MKYELTKETKVYLDKTLYRIRAVENFGLVSKGDLGGFIEKEENLSQSGDCWVYHEAIVMDNALVSGNARVENNAVVKDNAILKNEARVEDWATVGGKTICLDDAKIEHHARIFGETVILKDQCFVAGMSSIYSTGTIIIGDEAGVGVLGRIEGTNIIIGGEAQIYNDVESGAIITGSEICKFSNCSSDLSKDIASSIRVQTGLPVIHNRVQAYCMFEKDSEEYRELERGDTISFSKDEIDNDEDNVITYCDYGRFLEDKKNKYNTVLVGIDLNSSYVKVVDGKIYASEAFVVEIF
jgi:carbonic anhydrase/acetyltransferase-like protein (isoleucine patch superfamily)